MSLTTPHPLNDGMDAGNLLGLLLALDSPGEAAGGCLRLIAELYFPFWLLIWRLSPLTIIWY